MGNYKERESRWSKGEFKGRLVVKGFQGIGWRSIFEATKGHNEGRICM